MYGSPDATLGSTRKPIRVIPHMHEYLGGAGRVDMAGRAKNVMARFVTIVTFTSGATTESQPVSVSHWING